MNMSVKAMIFDLDGVLLDTAKFHYLAWKRLAQEWFNLDFTERDNEQFKGVNREACMRILCQMADMSLSEDRFQAGMDLKNEWYVTMVRNMFPSDVLPGARAYVEKQRAAAIKCAIGSASKNYELVLQRTRLRALFDAVADGTVVSKAKPDPEVFIRAAEMLEIPPVHCIVFEDAQAGIDAAKAAGMRCCAIGDSSRLSGYDWLYSGLAFIGANKEWT